MGNVVVMMNVLTKEEVEQSQQTEGHGRGQTRVHGQSQNQRHGTTQKQRQDDQQPGKMEEGRHLLASKCLHLI